MLFWVVFALCLGLPCYARSKVTESPPEWSLVYSVKGVLTIPYAELEEPFYAWFDGKVGNSRIDYYGGMAKTFQVGKGTMPPNGAYMKIVPETTETVLNQMTCFRSNVEGDVVPQPVLPDLTGFEYIGSEQIGGEETKKFRLVVKVEEKTSKYTMWVKYRKLVAGQLIAIPVRYEMKGVNTLMGSHFDHYYLSYYDFDVEYIDPAVFVPENVEKCGGFPGPGKHSRASFNPMAEFVHPVDDEHVHHQFDSFVRQHGRRYGDEKEAAKRREIFRQNLRFVSSHNRAGRSFTLALNHLADRTEDELKLLRGLRHSGEPNQGLPFPYSTKATAELADKLPTEHDWRIYGAVTPVKDQSVCGSCWAFGTVGAIEGALFLANGNHLVRLSQQALVDCSWGFGNNGCDGGEDFRAYQWVRIHGLPTEENYGGYLGQDGYCHMDNATVATKLKGWVNVTTGNENALRLAIFKHGPVSVAIDASPRSFTFYSHGVYYEPNCKNDVYELDHAVLAVGFGILNGKKYWLVKNSWSNLWGNDGYILMSSKDNNCGVMCQPTYVLI